MGGGYSQHTPTLFSFFRCRLCCASRVDLSTVERTSSRNGASYRRQSVDRIGESDDGVNTTRSVMKRSSSVPEIIMGCPGPSTGAAASTNLRTRRGISSSQISLPGDLARPAVVASMDTSSMSRAAPFSPIPISRLNSPTSRPHRVEQLKKEECIDERQSEKEVMEITNLNQSYEELRVDTSDVMDVWPSPSHSFLSPSSPLTKLGNSARSRSLTPTSPLPNRTYCRRSCSPVLRPSQLWAGQKRKREDSYNDVDMDTSPTLYPAKRFQPSAFTTTSVRAVSPSLSPTLTPNTGNSPLHHSSRKSSHSESTPLSSPSSLIAGGPLSTNPFAVNYDSGNCDHWQSGSASSSGGQSPLLINTTSSVTGRENGFRVAEDSRKTTWYQHAVDNLHIETTGLSDSTSDAPSPLSPKGLQFRHRPLPLCSSSIQSPIPRSISTVVNPASPSRTTPLPLSKSSSSLQHDKYLSPFNSDLGGHPLHGHAHTYPHSHANPHRQLIRVRHSSASSSSAPPPPSHRLQGKPEQGPGAESAKSFSNRLTVHSPLSKLSVSTSVEEYHCTAYHEGRRGGEGVGGGGRGDFNRRSVRKKRKNSEVSLDGRDETLMESDSSLTESCDEGIEMATNTKQQQT